MTEITEHRWKCDYCGVVSPVLTIKVDHSAWPPPSIVYTSPKGWTNDADTHFCCGYHEILYKNKQTASAKTPEEARV